MFIDFLGGGGRGMLLRQPRWTWRWWWWRVGWTDVLLTEWDTLDAIWIWKEKKKKNGVYRRQNRRFIWSKWKTRSKRCWTTRLTITFFGREREQQASSSKLRRRKREGKECNLCQPLETSWNERSLENTFRTDKEEKPSRIETNHLVVFQTRRLHPYISTCALIRESFALQRVHCKYIHPSFDPSLASRTYMLETSYRYHPLFVPTPSSIL